MNGTLKTVVFWIVIVVSAMLLWQVVRSAPEGRGSSEISYSRFISDIEAGNVASVTIAGTQIRGVYRDGKGTFRLTGPNSPSVYLDALRSKGAEIRFADPQNPSTPLQMMGAWAPLILLGALWFLMIRQVKKRLPPSGRGPGQTGFGPSLGPDS